VANYTIRLPARYLSVAGPGFDFRGAWTLSTGEGGKSLKVLTVELSHVSACFGRISKIRKFNVLGRKIIGQRPLGGAPPRIR